MTLSLGFSTVSWVDEHPEYEHGYERMAYDNRKQLLASELAKKICHICHEKKSNLCVVPTATGLDATIELANLIGDYICALKLNVDQCSDYSTEKMEHLQNIAMQKRFVILTEEHCHDSGINFFSQRSLGNPSILYFAQGINSLHDEEHDSAAKTIRKGADVIMVDNAICAAASPLRTAQEYQIAGWNAHKAAVGRKVYHVQTASGHVGG